MIKLHRLQLHFKLYTIGDLDLAFHGIKRNLRQIHAKIRPVTT